MRALVFLLLWPLVEIGLFVVVGGTIGLLATMAIVIASGIAGVVLLRRLGLNTADRLRGEMGRIRDPLAVAGDGALRMLAAILLILPGFLTDLLGLFLLLSPVRKALITALGRRVGAPSMRSDHPARRSDGIVIDGEFVEIDYESVGKGPPKSNVSSEWTRH